jgi:hypothetical protein
MISVRLIIQSQPELNNIYVDMTPAEVEEFSGGWFPFRLLDPTMDWPFPSPDDMVKIAS